MTVDPVDDCTFWYTNEYYLAGGSRWNTRIASFKFPNCTTSQPPPPTGTPLVSNFSVNSLRNNYTGFVGLRFTVGSTALTVNALGRVYIAGNTGIHTVKLVRASDGVDVPGASVNVSLPSGVAGQFSYIQLGSGVTLGANTAYYLVSQEAAGGDQWYDYGPVTTAAGAGTVTGPVYFAGGYVLVPSPGTSYVPVNFRYGTSTNAPPSVAITSPLANATISGTISITAMATAASGLTIASVQFKQNGNNIGAAVTGAGPSYSVQLNTATLVNETYQVMAVATDSAGGSATSVAIAITVSNAGGPPAGSPLIIGQSPTTLRNNFTGLVGMRFTTTSTPITVTSLGRICVAGNTGTHFVKLASANGVDLAGASISVTMTGCTPGAYQYAALASPIQLTANTTYHLVRQEQLGGDQWYDYCPVTMTTAGVVNGPVYFAVGYFLMTSPGYSYVPVNLLYQ